MNGWIVKNVNLNKEHYSQFQKDCKLVIGEMCKIGSISIDGDVVNIEQSPHPFSLISYNEPCRIDITEKLEMKTNAEISEPIDLSVSVVKEENL